MSKFKYLAILSLIAFTLAACERKAESTTDLNLSIPNKMTAMAAGDTLNHVVINVSGPGLETVFYAWDSNDSFGGAAATAPTSFKVSVLSGSNRLVQVLAVYKSSSSNSMNIYYGDSVQNLSGADMNLNLPVTLLGGSSGAEGKIQGRYLSSPSDGPTGKLQIRIRPLNGNPAMLIQESMMVSGWFKTFSLADQNFEYTVNGVDIFGGPKNLSYFEGLGGNAVLSLKMPNYYRNESGNPVLEYARADIRGFFGPGVSTQKICYLNTAQNLSGYYQDQAFGTPVSYSGNTTVSPIDAYLIGGVPIIGSCTGTPYVDYMLLNPANSSWNRDFTSPLQREYYFNIASFADLTTWDVLPGVSQFISNYSVYGVSQSMRNFLKNQDGDSIDCDKLIYQMALLPGEIVFGNSTTSIGATISSTIANMPAGASYVMCPTSSIHLPGIILN